MVQRLIEISGREGATISRGAARGIADRPEFSTREIANFWLLHAVNSALPPLRHLLIAKRGHPEELFVGDVAPGGRAVHLRARFASARPAALTITRT